jgi:hypothetical protein
VFLTAGLGFSLPTAADTRVRLSDETDMVRIRNQSLLVTPYFSALYAPDDRLFAQLWMAWNFDTNGNATDVNFDFGGLRQVGRVNDQTLAQIDTQLGYWVYRAADPSARLQGIAPFVELHYNGTVGRADVLSAGGFQIGTQGSLNELNLTLGATAQIGTNFLLSTGLVVPLRDNFDRSFDYQLGVRGTLFFGPTAAIARSSQPRILVLSRWSAYNRGIQGAGWSTTIPTRTGEPFMSTTVTWLGHSTLSIETAKHRLIIDPFFTGNPSCPLKAEDVTCDYILVSHGHGDHLGDCIPLAKRTGAKVIANYRDRLVAGETRDQGPRHAAWRRPRFSLWKSQDDAGFSRFCLAGRLVRRQPVPDF